MTIVALLLLSAVMTLIAYSMWMDGPIDGRAIIITSFFTAAALSGWAALASNLLGLGW